MLALSSQHPADPPVRRGILALRALKGGGQRLPNQELRSMPCFTHPSRSRFAKHFEGSALVRSRSQGAPPSDRERDSTQKRPHSTCAIS